MKPVVLMREPSTHYSGQAVSCGKSVVSYSLALQQHRAMQRIFRKHGYNVQLLKPSSKFISSVWVEDNAFVTGREAIVLQTSSKNRMGESTYAAPGEASVADLLHKYLPKVSYLGRPAALDGGDIVQTEKEIFVLNTAKASKAAIAQLEKKLDTHKPVHVVVCPVGIYRIHLKTHLTYLGNDTFIATKDASSYFRDFAPRAFRILVVPEEENNAGNCLVLNDGTVVVPSECKQSIDMLADEDYRVEPVDLSEYNKWNGSITCLSLVLEKENLGG